MDFVFFCASDFENHLTNRPTPAAGFIQNLNDISLIIFSEWKFKRISNISLVCIDHKLCNCCMISSDDQDHGLE